MIEMSPTIQAFVGVGVACVIIAVLSASVSYLTISALTVARKILP